MPPKEDFSLETMGVEGFILPSQAFDYISPKFDSSDPKYFALATALSEIWKINNPFKISIIQSAFIFLY